MKVQGLEKLGETTVLSFLFSLLYLGKGQPYPASQISQGPLCGTCYMGIAQVILVVQQFCNFANFATLIILKLLHGPLDDIVHLIISVFPGVHC